MSLKLLLHALVGTAAAAPTLDRSHDQQPIWHHKVHAWFCNHHPNSRWCQARGSPPAPPPTLSPKLLGADTPFQPQSKAALQEAVNAWCTGDKITYGNIALWDVSRIDDMGELFAAWIPEVRRPQGTFDPNKATCNPDISKWDTGKVTNMYSMFGGATAFNGDLSKWDTGNVTNMAEMFYEATSFNRDLSKWDTGKVTDMAAMFLGATSFTEKKFCPSAPEGVDLTCPF